MLPLRLANLIFWCILINDFTARIPSVLLTVRTTHTKKTMIASLIHILNEHSKCYSVLVGRPGIKYDLMINGCVKIFVLG